MKEQSSNRIVRNTLMLYLRMMVMTVISLYTSRVVLKVLGVEDFGIYNVVGGIVLMFSFMNSSMALSVNRFLSFELGRGDEKQFQRVFGESLIIHWLLAGVIVLISATAGWWFLNHQLQIADDRMWAAQWVFGLSVVAFVASIVRVPYHAAIVAYEHMQGSRFRHTAQFRRWRPDRDPQTCTYEQLQYPADFRLSDILDQ